MKKIGLVLSGGGTRGGAHLGVLKAIDELGIKISAISGVSAGAIIGSLYAAGFNADSIFEEFKDQSYFGVSNIAWQKSGLFTMGGLRKSLQSLIKKDDFDALKIPMFINATDIITGTEVVFSKGPLFEAIIASASVPVIFQPIYIGKYQLQDGGILNNLPVESLSGRCNYIIGSHVNKLCDETTPVKFTSVTLMDRCFHLAIAEQVKQQSKKCDVFIEPLMAGFGMFDQKNADKLFETGYKETMKHKDKLLKMLEDK